MALTIAYITNRKDPQFHWFAESLSRQVEGNFPEIVVVDFHAPRTIAIPGKGWITTNQPAPNVWSGPHRLTKADYFSASNASNTAIALCRTDWVVFVDDVSVLMPGWWNRAKLATERDGITLGTYRKVFELTVKEGIVTHYKDNPIGHDLRKKWHGTNEAAICDGQWFYGCSFVARIEDLLRCNGFDLDCDGMGYQDTTAGNMLKQHGVKFWFDPQLLTMESEELHNQPGNKFIRWDPGKSPNDKSHAIVDLVMRKGRTVAPNYYGPEGLRGLRQRVLRGEGFPVIQIPEHDWFTGLPLRELGDPPPKWP